MKRNAASASLNFSGFGCPALDVAVLVELDPRIGALELGQVRRDPRELLELLRLGRGPCDQTPVPAGQ